ncbi:trypsin-like peptidase domain-containing protein [Streptomyces sp. ML-6]|uniref:VMAP-C domain-containing protein n=1 Tax=Streptomyces sp. ML-6 TaxID=2982693 RepID=UPI0024C01985|nr:trypsin-like peptidase domain-containing protein [Streptomyces sp. ML-6]MDK0522167.1 serine protease [Streptomyces sp. ML-6]
MSLVKDATVRIHRPEPGYAPGESGGDFLGSGFFIAPSWVLTCAHVASEGRGRQVDVVYRTARGGEAVTVGGTVVAALPEERPATGGWPAPDLALIQLLRPVDHPCVYLSERSAGLNRGVYYFAGWAEGGAGALKRLGRECRVVGSIDDWSDGDEQMLIEASQLYPGMSGGPLVDLARGEVVGVLKSRSDDATGGTVIGIERLRTLPVPEAAATAESDDPYQAVFHAHDRYHADRHDNPVYGEETWADVQRDLGTTAGPALTPQQRVDLLGRLAKLPPPVSTRNLLDILGGLGHVYRPVGVPAPRGWRDGLGVLYDAREGDEALKLVLRYCMGVIAAERPYAVPSTKLAEEALWDWVKETAKNRLGPPFRLEMTKLRHRERYDPAQDDPARHGPASYDPAGAGREHGHPGEAEPSADRPDGPSGPAPFVLLSLRARAWEPDSYDWRIVASPSGPAGQDVPMTEDSQGTAVGDLRGRLAAPLTEAFRLCDEPGSPAVLQVSVPLALLDLEVEEWRLPPDGRPLGVQRPVVVRCSDERPELSDDGFREREARWNRTRTGPMRAAVLDCADALRVSVPAVAELRELGYETVPVLCRYGGTGDAQSLAGFVRVLDSGFGVALWRRPGSEPAAVCTEFHLRVGDTVAGSRSAERLPRRIHELRKGVFAGQAETYWSHGVVLMFDDPQQPACDAGELLQAP